MSASGLRPRHYRAMHAHATHDRVEAMHAYVIHDGAGAMHAYDPMTSGAKPTSGAKTRIPLPSSPSRPGTHIWCQNPYPSPAHPRDLEPTSGAKTLYPCPAHPRDLEPTPGAKTRTLAQLTLATWNPYLGLNPVPSPAYPRDLEPTPGAKTRTLAQLTLATWNPHLALKPVP